MRSIATTSDHMSVTSSKSRFLKRVMCRLPQELLKVNGMCVKSLVLSSARAVVLVCSSPLIYLPTACF